jgi:hypothetical protein
MLIFLSAEDTDDQLVQDLRDRLSLDGWSLDCSPRNPERGRDSRWDDWYANGCTTALANADVFVAVATAGWNSSTWMAHEAEAALDQGLEPFLWNPNRVPIPAGMRCFANATLPDSLAAAAEALAAHRASAPGLLHRHLRRLERFLQRLPGCPDWKGILIVEDPSASKPLDAHAAASAYVGRFDELTASYPWVNLHAAGIRDSHLIVSVETPKQRPTALRGRASIQLSGPDRRTLDRSGWLLLPDANT